MKTNWAKESKTARHICNLCDDIDDADDTVNTSAMQCARCTVETWINNGKISQHINKYNLCHFLKISHAVEVCAAIFFRHAAYLHEKIDDKMAPNCRRRCRCCTRYIHPNTSCQLYGAQVILHCRWILFSIISLLLLSTRAFNKRTKKRPTTCAKIHMKCREILESVLTKMIALKQSISRINVTGSSNRLRSTFAHCKHQLSLFIWNDNFLLVAVWEHK